MQRVSLSVSVYSHPKFGNLQADMAVPSPLFCLSSQSALSLVNSLIARGHLGQGTMIQRRGGELQQGFRRDNKDLSTMIVRKAIHLVPAI